MTKKEFGCAVSGLERTRFPSGPLPRGVGRTGVGYLAALVGSKGEGNREKGEGKKSSESEARPGPVSGGFIVKGVRCLRSWSTKTKYKGKKKKSVILTVQKTSALSGWQRPAASGRRKAKSRGA